MSRTPLLVAGSDNHLEYNAYVDYPAMWGDAYFALAQEVDCALQHRVPLVLAGDVFERNYPDSYSLKQLFDQLDRLAAGGQAFYFVQGQHELSRRKPWCGLHAHAFHLHQQTRLLKLSPGQQVVYGLDWQPAAALAWLAAEVPPEVTVLVLHQVWREFMGDHVPTEGSLAELVPDHVRLVITGDFHGHCQKHLKNKNGNEFTVLSPGSAVWQSVMEDHEKYFYLVYDDLSYESVPLKGRRVVRTRSQTPEQLAHDVTDAVNELQGRDPYLTECLATPAWIAQYHESLAPHKHLIEQAAKGRAHLFLRHFGASSAPAEEDADATGDVATFEEALAAEVGGAGGPVCSTVMRLWGAADPAAELAAVVEEMLAAPVEGPPVAPPGG